MVNVRAILLALRVVTLRVVPANRPYSAGELRVEVGSTATPRRAIAGPARGLSRIDVKRGEADERPDHAAVGNLRELVSACPLLTFDPMARLAKTTIDEEPFQRL